MKYVLNLDHPFTGKQLDYIYKRFGVDRINCFHTNLQLNEGDDPSELVKDKFNLAQIYFGFMNRDENWADVAIMLPESNLLAAITIKHYISLTGRFPTIILLEVPSKFVINGSIIRGK